MLIPDSLRFFSFSLEEKPFDPSAYCVQQLIPQREGKDLYHPFLVAVFALDGEPPGIACCNALKESRPDPGLVRSFFRFEVYGLGFRV